MTALGYQFGPFEDVGLTLQNELEISNSIQIPSPIQSEVKFYYSLK